MKRLVLFLAIFALLGASLSAQYVTGSLLERLTFDIFSNELDYSLNVDETLYGGSFSGLEKKYFFGGLENLDLRANTFGPGGNLPFIGLYLPGEQPMSVVGTMNATTITAVDISSDTDTLANDGGGQYVGSNTAVNFQAQAFNTFSTEAQFLIGLGGLNVGAYLDIFIDDNAAAANNFDETFTQNYNGAAAPAVDTPSQQTDYVQETKERDAGGTATVITLGVPVFLTTGDLAHLITFNLTYDRLNNSTSTEETLTTLPEIATAGLALSTDSTKDVTTEINISPNYILTLPALFGEHEMNDFKVGGGLSFTMHSRNFVIDDVTVVNDYAGGRAAGTFVAGGTSVDQTLTYRGNLDMNFNVGASHSFYYNPASFLTVGIEPSLGFFLDVTPETNLTLTENAIKSVSDTTGDGAYDNIVSYQTTTFTEVATDDSTVSTTIAANIPMAAVVEPEGWFFGVIMGADASMSYTREVVSNDTNAASSVETFDINDVSQGTTPTTTVGGGNTTREVDHFWAFDFQHSFGLTFDLGEGVRADLQLNGSNLFVFDSLDVQLIVGLE